MKAFTLSELLVAIAIVAIVAGIALPVINGAKRSAKETRCMSNLRQLGMAAILYQNENGDYPTNEAVSQLERLPVSYDPSDNWRTTNPTLISNVLVGSYGYARRVDELKPENRWREELREVGAENAILFADIFHAQEHVEPFSGTRAADWKTAFYKYPYPTRILTFREQGNSMTLKRRHCDFRNGPCRVMDWQTVFIDDSVR